MTEHQLDSDSNEWHLLLVSLQAFSDACAAPELTPACPFYQPDTKGPTCGEQCMDLLATYRDELPPRPGFSLGDGYEVISRPSRRARRGPEPTTRPFDARFYRARDRDKPTDTKHTVSLLVELTELLSIPPHLADDRDERRYLIGAIVGQLIARGFHGEDLRKLIVRRTGVALGTWTAITRISQATPIQIDKSLALSIEWEFVAEQFVNVTFNDEQRIVNVDPDRLINALFSWFLQQETIEAVYEWANLPTSEFIAQHLTDSHVGTFEQANWIVDRFTETYAQRWATTSLDLEWKYLHGREPGCCGATQMQLRRTRLADISNELAARAVDARTSSKRGRSRFEAGDFVETAASLLSAERYESAAALFEALRKVAPNDPDLANNLGFCLMPTDPERALQVLNEAARLDERGRPVIWANRMAALYILYRDDEVTALFEEGCESTTETAWLWVVDTNRKIVRLGTDMMIGAYAADLRDRIVS